MCFTFLPEVTTNRWWLYLVSVMYIVNNSLNPFIYLSLNTIIGGYFRGMLGRRSNRPPPSGSELPNGTSGGSIGLREFPSSRPLPVRFLEVSELTPKIAEATLSHVATGATDTPL